MEDMVDIINQAVYAENISKDHSIVLHTGITFEIQTGTKFEIIYNLSEHFLIYQPYKEIKLPCIAGLILTSTRQRFYDTYSSSIIVDAILSSDSPFSWLDTNDQQIDNNTFNHKLIILDEAEKLLDTFPLGTHLKQPIFYFGSEFKLYDED